MSYTREDLQHQAWISAMAHICRSAEIDTLANVITDLVDVGVTPSINENDYQMMWWAVQEIHRAAQGPTNEKRQAEAEYWVDHLERWGFPQERHFWDCPKCGWVHHPANPC